MRQYRWQNTQANFNIWQHSTCQQYTCDTTTGTLQHITCHNNTWLNDKQSQPLLLLCPFCHPAPPPSRAAATAALLPATPLHGPPTGPSFSCCCCCCCHCCYCCLSCFYPYSSQNIEPLQKKHSVICVKNWAGPPISDSLKIWSGQNKEYLAFGPLHILVQRAKCGMEGITKTSMTKWDTREDQTVDRISLHALTVIQIKEYWKEKELRAISRIPKNSAKTLPTLGNFIKSSISSLEHKCCKIPPLVHLERN